MFTRLFCSAVLTALLSVGAVENAAADDAQVIATRGGYTLTEADFERTLTILTLGGSIDGYSEDDLIEIREELIAEFEASPGEFLTMLYEYYAKVAAVVPELSQSPAQERDPFPYDVAAAASGPSGHRQMRATLASFLNGSQLSRDAYDTTDVNQFRAFIANSQIVSSAYGEYYTSKRVYTFCPGGYFTYSFGSATSITGRDMDMEYSGVDRETARGVWDTYHEGGQVALLLYSAEPAFADESLNNTGLLPLPIAQYQADLIQLGKRGDRATADMLLRRTAFNGCQ